MRPHKSRRYQSMLILTIVPDDDRRVSVRELISAPNRCAGSMMIKGAPCVLIDDSDIAELIRMLHEGDESHRVAF